MKTIFFTGIAGGTGKTTLAHCLAGYLFYYHKKSVNLLTLESLNSYQFLHRMKDVDFPIIPISGALTNDTFKSIPLSDYTIVDLGNLLTSKAVESLSLPHYSILPLVFSEVTFIKTQAAINLLNRNNTVSEKLFILPNQYSKKHNGDLQADCDHFFEKNKIDRQNILPPVTRTKHLLRLHSGPPSPKLFNIIRPSFTHLFKNIE